MMTCEDCQRDAMEFVAVAEGHIVCRECAKAYFEIDKVVAEDAANIAELERTLDEWEILNITDDELKKNSVQITGDEWKNICNLAKELGGDKMSDKLEKCVCGGDAYIKTSTYGYFKYCNKHGCVCRTPVMMSPEEAAISWSKMQRALKSGWSSEVPTEEGFYLVYDAKQKYIFEACLIPQALPTLVVRYCGVYSNILDFCKKNVFFWFRINYPEPPQAVDHD